MDAAVPITVANVEVPSGSLGEIGWFVEGFPLGRWFILSSEGEEEFTILRELSHSVVPIVNAVETRARAILNVYVGAMGVGEDPLPSTLDELSLAIEDYSGRLSAAEDKDSALGVYGYPSDLRVYPAYRELPPAFHDLIL